MLSSSQFSHFPGKPQYHVCHPTSMRVFLCSPHMHLPILNFPTLGHLSSLHGTKELSCLTKQLSPIYEAGAMHTTFLMA